MFKPKMKGSVPASGEDLEGLNEIFSLNGSIVEP
jgi:hypothetical protein